MRTKNRNMKALSLMLAILLSISLLLAPGAFALDDVSNDANSADSTLQNADFAPEDAANDADIQEITEKSSVLNESDIIYMILTDRFYDSDSSNNGTLGQEYRPGELKYTQGGD